MKTLIIALALVISSCSQITLDDELFERVWQLQSVDNNTPQSCPTPYVLIFFDNSGDISVQVNPVCSYINVEVYPVMRNGDYLSFHWWNFHVESITNSILIMDDENNHRYVYRSR